MKVNMVVKVKVVKVKVVILKLYNNKTLFLILIPPFIKRSLTI